VRILVVEQDGSVARWLRRTFGDEVHAVDAVTSAAEAAQSAAIRDYDLVVMDIDLGLSDQNGHSAVVELRRLGGAWPIIVVSASGEDRHVIDAVNAGADDYLVKPVSEGVLVAHVRAVLRRTAPTRTDQIFLGDVILDRATHHVRGSMGEARLTAKEYAVLELFLSNPQRVIPRSELLARVWGFTFEPRTSVVEVAVSRVRRKLGKVSSRVRVLALRNVGFITSDEHQTVEHEAPPQASPNGKGSLHRGSGTHS
jgi:DNA-binding response OmpR family regulator